MATTNKRQRQEPNIRVGCGCWGCLMEIIAFVLICSLFGCEWARNTISEWTRWMGGTVHRAWETPGDKAVNGDSEG